MKLMYNLRRKKLYQDYIRAKSGLYKKNKDGYSGRIPTQTPRYGFRYRR